MSHPSLMSPGVQEFVLAFADDEHFVGSHLAWWIGVAPFLEEDLSLCSIAQDELGHAIALYELLTDEVDQFALRRDAAEYRSCSFAEVAMPKWEDTLVRHWLYDIAEDIRWNALVDSTADGVPAVAQRALSEERFHRTHSTLLLQRSLTGSSDAKDRLVAAMELLLPQSMTMWSPVAGEAEAVATGVTAMTSAEAADRYVETVRADLDNWDVTVSWDPQMAPEGDRLLRAEGFSDFQASLNLVLDLDPNAEW